MHTHICLDTVEDRTNIHIPYMYLKNDLKKSLHKKHQEDFSSFIESFQGISKPLSAAITSESISNSELE